MGYTLYWNKDDNSTKSSDELQPIYTEALVKVKQFINDNDKNLANGSGDENTKPVFDDESIAFNGIGDESHETMWLPTKFSDMGSFEFCKTARKVYGSVAWGCLLIIKSYLGKDFDIRSDGSDETLLQAEQLVKDYTK